MALVFGIGSGLFSLTVLWVIGIFVVFLLSRTGGSLRNATIPVVLILCITTIVMIIYPRKSLDEELQTKKQAQNVDNIWIPRIVLFTFICLFTLIGFVFLVQHWLEPVYSPAVTAKRIYSF
ncbi:transmembrane protein 218-like [Rhopilema esculentum]|uniref:transmembrane protein 218-like n=1 Tax=Rhopilema esculentum TaxID=499914 RepID=UPI0031D3D532